jgi:DNA polymerase-3 subunit epsilon
MSPKSNYSWAIYAEKDANGYLNLKLQKADGRKKEVKSYTSLQEGKEALVRITSDHKLCQKLTGLYITKTHCLQHTTNECDGACVGKITATEYNERVQEFIEKNLFDNKTMVIVDKGRTVSERSAILVENGVYKGYAFYDLNYQINTLDILRNIIVPMQSNRDTRNSIQAYLRKNKYLKIVNF